VHIARAAPADLPFLERMWHVAAFWRPEELAPEPDVAMQVPELARYIAEWGRPVDVALVALVDGEPVGAAWYRLFTTAEPGYGFVAADVPEVAVGVEPAARGRGVATALLEALLEHARRDGFRAVSLSVNEDNPSRRIYLRLGFRDVAHEDGSYVMVRTLRDGRSPSDEGRRAL
jgi:GNAT superfamily N-acetyltransferase